MLNQGIVVDDYPADQSDVGGHEVDHNAFIVDPIELELAALTGA
jgi:hypothetical protein